MTHKTLDDLVQENATPEHIQTKIEKLPLPPFVKYFLTDGLIQAHEAGKKVSFKNGLQDVILRLGQEFMRQHPELQNDPEILQEIQNSKLTDAYKWFLIDGVLAHSPAKAWPHGGTIFSPIEQLSFFETQINSGSLDRTSMEVPFPVKQLWRSAVTIETAGEVPEFIRNRFLLPGGRVEVPVHPVVFDGRMTSSQSLAQGAEKIPFSYAPTYRRWMGKLTASRSTFFGAVSVKIPTQFPNPTWTPENKKILVIDDVRESLPRTRLINAIDTRLGRPKGLVLLKDVMAIHDHATGNAILIRDTSPLLDGHHYMPAFSTPEVGKVIARKLGVDFEPYWMKHYAYSWGRTKALLLIRYGLVLESSHEQQWLLQMKIDEKRQILVPTDVNAVRDLGDTLFVGPIAEMIAPEFLEKDQQHRRVLNDFNDLRMASLTDGHFLDTAWSDVHQQGIRETIETELGIKLPENWYRGEYLSSDVFQAALRKYHHLNHP